MQPRSLSTDRCWALRGGAKTRATCQRFRLGGPYSLWSCCLAVCSVKADGGSIWVGEILLPNLHLWALELELPMILMCHKTLFLFCYFSSIYKHTTSWVLGQQGKTSVTGKDGVEEKR